MENKILFLDFDGVLFDTLKEVYLITRYIYLGIDFLKPIDEENYALFSKYKYLVYNIWMFYYFNPLIFENYSEKEIVNNYKSAIVNRDKTKENEFCTRFLDARRELVNNYFEFWKNLETPYDFFYEVKKMYDNGNKNIVIISKKNKNSIIERFSTYDFDLKPEFIFAREILDNYFSKGEFINEYMLKHNYDSAIFVDDNMNNLKMVQNKNVKTILALWGNTEPDDIGLNQKEAIEEIKNYFISR